MKNITILLALGCVLAYVGSAQAECCRASLTMSYTLNSGTCADAGGRPNTSGCTITVCADGKAQQGTYCGRRSCNIFGCACGGGCITGNWQQSFEQLNGHLGVRVWGAQWNS